MVCYNKDVKELFTNHSLVQGGNYMVSIGDKIKYLRKHKNITQEELADLLHISFQAVSKWENGVAQPDISMIPVIANYFGVTIDELFGYKLNAMTHKERFIQFMVNNGALKINSIQTDFNKDYNFMINTEQFDTNAQISKIGVFFADAIRENNLEFDTLIGLAYHGIAFSTATSTALFDKYGMTINYCYDRLVPDSRGRIICGHTLQENEKVVIIDDLIFSGKTLIERIDQLKKTVNIDVIAVIVIADCMTMIDDKVKTGAQMIEEKYGIKVFSIITKNDIINAIHNDVITSKEYLVKI
ncbi:MAG: orotate phosphoribosyltransferase [Herbinix sp.]|jgi:orotate phosphoribosyltransferase|nr:orotate phosphoribosyltransferase [Herbinix sp.]